MLAHVAGAVFTTDKTAGKWISLSGYTLSQIQDSTTAALIGTVGPSNVQADLTRRAATVALMKALTGLVNNQTVNLLGYYAADGKGSGLFRYDSGSAAAVNTGTVFALDSMPGRLIRYGFTEVDVAMFGAIGDGIANDRPAIVAADAYCAANFVPLHLPSGTYLIGSAFAFSDYAQVRGVGRKKSIIKRGFTGNMITSLGTLALLEDIGIDGDTALRGAGKGVLVTSGVGQIINRCEIKNFVEPVVEYSADAGSMSRITSSDLITTGAAGTVGSVTINGTDTSAKPRHFYNNEGGGSTLYNFGGANDQYVSGGYSNGLIYGAASSKVLVNNMRLGTTYGPMVINGGNHILTNSIVADSITINATDSIVDATIPAGYVITDNGTGNNYTIGSQSYTTTWTGTGSNPAIGNGTITGTYVVNGRMVTASAAVVMGGTTTYGGGTYRISLPLAAANIAGASWTGTVKALDSGTNIRIGAAVVSANTAYVELFFDSAVGAAEPTAPFTWASGDQINLTISYLKY